MKAVKESKGQGLALINPWRFPANEPWKTKFFYDMWKSALEHDSSDGFHCLTLYTPQDNLEGALELAVSHHNAEAIVPLLNSYKVFELCPCSQNCKKCEEVFLRVKQWFPSLTATIESPRTIDIPS